MNTQDSKQDSKQVQEKVKKVVSHSDNSVLRDASHVLGKVKEHRADFEARDAKRKRKLVTAGDVHRWEADVEGAMAAESTYRVALAASVAATAKVVAARADVIDDLTGWRADVILRLADHPEMAGEFGFHNRLRPGSTGEVLAAARTAMGAYEASHDKAALAEAGLGEARVKSLGDKVEALSELDVARTITVAARNESSAAKKAAFARVAANTALLRKIVRLEFRDRPDLQRAFRTALPRTTRPVRPSESPAPAAPVEAAPAALASAPTTAAKPSPTPTRRNTRYRVHPKFLRRSNAA